MHNSQKAKDAELKTLKFQFDSIEQKYQVLFDRLNNEKNTTINTLNKKHSEKINNWNDKKSQTSDYYIKKADELDEVFDKNIENIRNQKDDTQNRLSILKENRAKINSTEFFKTEINDFITHINYLNDEIKTYEKYNRLNGLTFGNDDFIATEDTLEYRDSLIGEAGKIAIKKRNSISEKTAYKYGIIFHELSQDANPTAAMDALLVTYEMYLILFGLDSAPLMNDASDFFEKALKGDIDIEKYIQDHQENLRFKEQSTYGEDDFDNENENPDDAMLGKDDQVVTGLSQQKNKNDSAKGFTPGGIDLNEDKLDLIERGSGIDFKIPDGQVDAIINAEGFVPVIIQIAPMTNLPLFLGLSDENLNKNT